MMWLIGLLALETVCEGLVSGQKAGTETHLRRIWCVFCIGLLAAVTLLLAVRCWRVWLWSVPFAAYRIINLLRVYTGRLPQARLRAVAWGAFFWLVIMQLLVTLIVGVVYALHAGRLLLDIVAVLQLLAAVLLLRATRHTWRHAGPIGGEPALSDRELPAVSVLVPARNETDALERCLERLIASDYPKLEIIALDDHSDDRRTPEIIRSFARKGVRFIKGAEPEDTRWLAKNYAQEQLLQAASGDVLLFCGVDAELESHSLRRLVEILEARHKNMLSVLPLRRAISHDTNSLYQAMRYWWELCLPRRVFKRPPVLATCWLIRREALVKMGGFTGVSRSVNAEAPLARMAVTTDSYSFIRSDDALGVYSGKPATEQYATSERLRYPQLHRRLELVAVATLAEAAFLLGPLIGLLLAGRIYHSLPYVLMWVMALAGLLVTYGFAAVATRVANPVYGWLLMPVAVIADLAVLHMSLWRYEFGRVEWKGRNVSGPVMQLADKIT
ncbi:MAG TPA: glycosyltransferase [Candidatus Saccharimonadales bacterium]|jgi:hypothetical protein